MRLFRVPRTKAGVLGTILEDFLTLGGGIADDLPSFILAYRIVRFA